MYSRYIQTRVILYDAIVKNKIMSPNPIRYRIKIAQNRRDTITCQLVHLD